MRARNFRPRLRIEPWYAGRSRLNRSHDRESGLRPDPRGCVTPTMPRNHRIVRRLTASLLLWAVSASTAYAIFDPCLLVGNASVSPRHPGPADVVDISVSLHWLLLPDGAGVRILSRARLDGPETIAVEAILTTDPADIPGYREVSVPFWADSTFGAVGPLPAGTYTVRSDVLSWNAQEGRYGSVCPGLPRTTALIVGEQPQPVSTVRVVEFRHAALDHYFMTPNPAEIADLDGGVHSGWARTGESFTVYATGGSDDRGSPTCRWYGLPAFGLDSHYFSASLVECGNVANSPLTTGRWKQEALNAFEATLPDTTTGACPVATTPVYRLWNNRIDSNHRYTTKPSIKQSMIAKGYVSEGFGPDGVAMCALAQ